jgi:hypothetical protein
MTLIDVLEMLCDWIAAAEDKGNNPKDGMVKFQFPKYRIDGDLRSILLNTLNEIRNGR